MTTKAGHFIAGTLVAGGPRYFRASNPADGNVLPVQYPEATLDDVNEALAAAANAFSSFRIGGSAARALFLDAIAQELQALGDSLINQAHLETALPLDRLARERDRTLHQIHIFAEMVRDGSWVGARISPGDPQRKPAPRPDVRSMLTPVGPVVVFGASNFPLAISVAGTDTVSALAAGCPVVVKAHPSHPGTCGLVASAIAKARTRTNMPAGVFSMLYGAGHDVGAALVRHPATAAVAFTGSTVAGRSLLNVANARPNPIPVYAEMGSVNPVFVLPGALAARGQQIAKDFVQSLTLGVGQYCTNPGILVVCQGDGLSEFLAALKQVVADVPPATMLNAGILRAFSEGVAALEATQGVTTFSRAVAPANERSTQAACSVFLTTPEVIAANATLNHEVFGPASVVVQCKSREEVLGVARMMQGQLTASVHAEPRELPDFLDLLHLLEQKVGRVVFDGFATGIEVCSAMHHGGPYPATTNAQFTSVGHASIYRFVRPVAFQNTPDLALPAELQNANPLNIRRLVDETLT